MHKTVVLNVVGLSGSLLGEHTPELSALARAGERRPLRPAFPAVTCTAQASMLTGSPPRDHGVVGNGWFFRDLSEIWFWRQSAKLYQGERVWEAGRKRDPRFRCAKLFWWYNMYDSAEVAVTPRPMYPADGRKLPDIWTWPLPLRQELRKKLGAFPLFHFWGPRADLRATQWIERCAEHVFATEQPTLTLIYLPHLDYCLQKLGPEHPELPMYLGQIDSVCGRIIGWARAANARIVVLSEYGVVPVRDGTHPNRALREAGWLQVREELGRELLDPGASTAFAVADHQLAHVYVRESGLVAQVRRRLERLEGVAAVLDRDGQTEHGLAHARSGELVLVSQPERWFSYYYWHDDRRAPDFARCVDIHRKPGYDPVELFTDPEKALMPLRLAGKLLRKKLGFRTLMDVIPLDASLVRGSHGLVPATPDEAPVLVSSERGLLPTTPHAQDIKSILLEHVFA